MEPPLSELAASLAVSVDMVARQQLEIKRLKEHINALKKKVGAVTNGVPGTRGKNFPPCKHCKAVGQTAPHRQNKWYFKPKKNKERMSWAKRLIEAEGVLFNDEWHVGTAKTVVLKNPNKETLMYKASLIYSPTRKTYILEENKNSLPPEQTGIVDSCATHLYSTKRTTWSTGYNCK